MQVNTENRHLKSKALIKKKQKQNKDKNKNKKNQQQPPQQQQNYVCEIIIVRLQLCFFKGGGVIRKILY